jgi:hypothetical protein
MTIDEQLDAARADIYARINVKCAAELLRTRQQGEFARRSLGQKQRWANAKGRK